MANFSAAHPEKIASQLAQGYKETEKLIEQVKASNLSADEKYNVTFELETKKAQFNNALSEALGLSVSAVMAPDKEPNPCGPCSSVIPTPPASSFPARNLV